MRPPILLKFFRDPAPDWTVEKTREAPGGVAGPRYWLQLYREIVGAQEAAMEGMRRLMAAQAPPAREDAESGDLALLSSHLAHFRARLEYWESKLPEGP